MPLYAPAGGTLTQTAQVTIPTLSIGANDITVTWSQPFNDATYTVSGPALELGPVSLGKIEPSVKSGSRTTTTCVITLTNTALVSLTSGGTLHVVATQVS